MMQVSEIVENTRMEPRDAVHVASTRSAGITTIKSEDRDLDRVSGIARVGSGAFLSTLGL